MSVRSLLDLLRHPDPDVRAQGIELLHALPPSLHQDAYARAAQAGESQLAALISGGGDPILTSWHTRRIWCTAAHTVVTAHTDAGAPLHPDYQPFLTELQAILSGPPTATRRVAAGRIRLWLEDAWRATPRPAARSWFPPAHTLFYAPPATQISPSQALMTYRADLAEQLCCLTRRELNYLSEPEQLLHQRLGDLALLQLASTPEVLTDLKRQALLRADNAPVTTQRALFERLDRTQREQGDTLQRARTRQLKAWWSQKLRDLGAAADSAVFRP